MAHITEEQIRKYYRHELEQADEIALLHHVAQCEYCAGKLAAGLRKVRCYPCRGGFGQRFWNRQTGFPEGVRGSGSITVIAPEWHLACAWHWDLWCL